MSQLRVRRKPKPSAAAEFYLWLREFRKALSPESELTPRELECLRAFATYGDMQTAAYALGVSLSNMKTRCSTAYARLGVTNNVEAFQALGWLTIPT